MRLNEIPKAMPKAFATEVKQRYIAKAGFDKWDFGGGEVVDMSN